MKKAMDLTPDNHLWYRTQAEAFTESLPLGNGRLGASVYGRISDETIVLNEISLWSGSISESNRSTAYQHLDDIRELLISGKNKEAEALVNEYFTCEGPGTGFGQGSGVPFGCYQTLGRLALDIPTNDEITDYRRYLSLREGQAVVEYCSNGVGFRRTIIVSAPQDIVAIKLEADKLGCIAFRTRLDREERACTEIIGDNEMHMFGTLNDGKGGEGMRFSARLRVLTVGGTVTARDGYIEVCDADEAVLLISAATDYSGFAGRNTSDCANASKTDLSGAASLPFNTLSDSQSKDHRYYYDRVSLRLQSSKVSGGPVKPTDERLTAFYEGSDDPDLAALYFNYGRYLLISSSRPGGLPANLQGLWADSIQTPWNGDYHLNINIQMNYWPAEVCNLAELHTPLLRLIESLQMPGARTAVAYYGAPGWVAHTITNVWGYTSPGESASWGSYTGGSSWLCSHLWEHYAFNGDIEYLKWAYQIMKGSAEFYLSTLVEERNHGWLVTAPSNSPENAFVDDNGDTCHVCLGPTIDMQQLR